MRNTEIKALFVDLDGTLLQGVDTVSPRTRLAFAQIRKAGVLPVIATGRLAYEADFAVRAIGADGYMIAMNGLAVYEDYRTGTLLYEAGMPEKTTKNILRILLEQNVFFEAYAGNRAHCQRDRVALIQCCGMDEEHIRFFSDSMEVVEDLPSHLFKRKLKVNKFFASLENPADIPPLRRALDALPGVRTISAGEHYVEIVPEGADKQQAVRMVREVLGLSKDQIMVIGDSENDLGMFDQAHTCVAMGNACPALKAKANYIAPPNCEDGVAWAVETLLLGESAPRLTGHIETIDGEEIARSLEHSTRQYLTGDLKLPQQLRFLYDPEVEVGISGYPYYRWEHPHYHTLTAEYCYILEGETKYIDLSENTEHCFTAGDFYILRRNTPYLQKSKPGCRLLFVKVPGVNDKVEISLDDRMRAWCVSWDAVWDRSQIRGDEGTDERCGF